MRSSGTPARIASTTPRTIVRTSSSASDALTTSVPRRGLDRGDLGVVELDADAPQARDAPRRRRAASR